MASQQLGNTAAWKTMGTSSALATILDIEMLRTRGVTIYPSGTPLSVMTPVADLAFQLGGCYLLRYLLPAQLGTLLAGATWRQFATPTPYAPEETIIFLALPFPKEERSYVVLLDPSRLVNVYGPRQVRFGLGIEYILDTGFTADAIVSIATEPPGSWELEVR